MKYDSELMPHARANKDSTGEKVVYGSVVRFVGYTVSRGSAHGLERHTGSEFVGFELPSCLHGRSKSFNLLQSTLDLFTKSIHCIFRQA
jgi:hypothetical protein